MGNFFKVNLKLLLVVAIFTLGVQCLKYVHYYVGNFSNTSALIRLTIEAAISTFILTFILFTGLNLLSRILVENRKYVGYGYFDEYSSFNNLEEIKSQLVNTKYYPDANDILRGWLTQKRREVKVIC